MPLHKHLCINNYSVFKGVGCGFIVNGKRHMAAQIYVVIILFII